MRDEETGSYWQQISGLAVAGPLRGRQLTLILSDELTLAAWKSEEPRGTVLNDVPKYVGGYARRDWDVRMQRAPTVIDFPEHGLKARDLMLGIQAFGASRAFLYDQVIREKLVKDRVGGQPVLLVVGPDGGSVRAFLDRIPGGDGAAFFSRAGGNQGGPVMMDAATGSQWNFQGCAVS